MKQRILTGFEKVGKTTRRVQFLADMHKIIPWTELAAAVQTAYPKVSENDHQPPVPLERMLRIYSERRRGVGGDQEKTNVEAQNVKSKKARCEFRTLNTNPPSSPILMTISADFP